MLDVLDYYMLALRAIEVPYSQYLFSVCYLPTSMRLCGWANHPDDLQGTTVLAALRMNALW